MRGPRVRLIVVRRNLASGPSGSLSTPFDIALEQRELQEAVDTYASRYGEPGSPAYREAWARFRQQIRTDGDLRQARDARRRPTESAPDS